MEMLHATFLGFADKRRLPEQGGELFTNLLDKVVAALVAHHAVAGV